jgi:hypothetical protein
MHASGSYHTLFKARGRQLTFPLFETELSSRPLSIPGHSRPNIDTLLHPDRDRGVRMRRPLPSRSASTHLPSLCWMVAMSSSANSFRLRAQPTSNARMT